MLKGLRAGLLASVVLVAPACAGTNDPTSIPSVDTIVNLRAKPLPFPSQTPTVFVSQTNQVYGWAANSSVADNGVSVVNPTGNLGNGRWIYPANGLGRGECNLANVPGAFWDGVHDDWTVLNTYLQAQPVGQTCFAPGLTTLLGTEIDLTKSIFLRGTWENWVSTSGTVFKFTSTNGFWYKGPFGSSCEFSNMLVKGAGAGVGVKAGGTVNVTGCIASHWHDLVVRDFSTQIELGTFENNQMENIWVLGGAYGVKVTDNVFSSDIFSPIYFQEQTIAGWDDEVGGFDYTIRNGDAEAITGDGFIIRGPGVTLQGMRFESTPGVGKYDVKVIGELNRVIGNNNMKGGILLSSAGAVRNLVEGNYCQTSLGCTITTDATADAPNFIGWNPNYAISDLSGLARVLQGGDYNPNARTTGTDTFVVNAVPLVERFTTASSGDITITLSTTGAWRGMIWHIVAPSNLNGHTFTVSGKSLTANQWAEFTYDGAAYVETAGGTLP